MLPDLLGGKGENRRHEVNQCLEDPIERCLNRAPLPGIGPLAVETVLHNVQIKGAQIDAAKVVQGMIDDMKLKILIGLATSSQKGLRPMENPTVQLGEGFGRHRVFLRIKVVEVTD
jgi:hypothetical protein